MTATVLHHVGLRVADAERAAAFYVDVLGAAPLVRPTALEGRGADQAAQHPGVRMRVAMVSFGDVAVELFEFVGDDRPAWAAGPAEGTIPHLALQVPDTDAALERVEAAGGRRVWPAVDRFGRARCVYVRDPDGNVLELLDAPPADIAGLFHRVDPASKP